MYSNNMTKWTGWHTLKIDDVLPTVRTALRLYSRSRPLLKMKSRRHNLDDGVTEWRIRCDGKAIGSVTLEPTTKGVRFVYTIRLGERSALHRVASHEMAQIFTDIKDRIDFEHVVGVNWKIRGIPRSIQVRKK